MEIITLSLQAFHFPWLISSLIGFVSALLLALLLLPITRKKEHGRTRYPRRPATDHGGQPIEAGDADLKARREPKASLFRRLVMTMAVFSGVLLMAAAAAAAFASEPLDPLALCPPGQRYRDNDRF